MKEYIRIKKYAPTKKERNKRPDPHYKKGHPYEVLNLATSRRSMHELFNLIHS